MIKPAKNKNKVASRSEPCRVAPLQRGEQTTQNLSPLESLGVFGYQAIEPVILTALVTRDPLLLIGPAGTGKTYLLNRLSEALGLEHRHYNASLIAFDDLVGFPFPNEDKSGIEYLQTPATVWNAESVLVDEINRCRPEHQNRLFSLIHERRLQGIQIESLIHRWAAMNPCGESSAYDSASSFHYDGAVPLDQALADRFNWVVDVPDWHHLTEREQNAVANPDSDALDPKAKAELVSRIAQARTRFEKLLANPSPRVVQYARLAATLFGKSDLRCSPRRVRQLTRNLLGLAALDDGPLTRSSAFLGLTWSLPHRAWGQSIQPEVIRGVHRTAWDAAFDSGDEAWLNQVLIEPRLHLRVRQILTKAPSANLAGIAVIQTIHQLPEPESLAFAFALYPAALEGRLGLSREGIQALAKRCHHLVDVKGEIKWRASEGSKVPHGRVVDIKKALSRCRGGRRTRGQQLLYGLLIDNKLPRELTSLEQAFHDCVLEVRKRLRKEVA